MMLVASLIARCAGWLSRRLGKGGGTTLPGLVLLKLRKNAIAELASDLRHGAVLVSATNGKTTTTRLLGSSLTAAGYRVVTNAEGSNLERGIATSLLKGSGDADLALFEVDEAALAAVATDTGPSVVVLMNLFRDQLDRYGELETLVEKWREVLDRLEAQHEPPFLVLNADDPNIAALGRGRQNVVWFGLDDLRHSAAMLDHAADATTCRECGTELEHAAIFVGHLGHWSCPKCDATRPKPDVCARRVEIGDDHQTVTITYPAGSGTAVEVTVESPLPGLHNAYNLTAAFAASWALAERYNRPLEAQQVARALGSTKPAFGRGELVSIGDKAVQLLLAKNPTGVNQNLHTIMGEAPNAEPLQVLVLLNDRTADGQDVSWIWDVDWEPLGPRLASLTLGGERAWDLALRFRYGGFDMERIKVAPDVDKALDVALSAVPEGGVLRVLPTYTAMLDLRWELTQRGHTTAYWSENE